MKLILIFTLVLTLALAGDKKPLPGQAGNDDIELVGSLILDRQEIEQALGADLGAGYVLARVKVTPKSDKPLHIGVDDFTMLSRKDGQRCSALEPSQIAGKGALIVKRAANQPGGAGTATNGPIWGSVGPVGMGNTRSPDKPGETQVERSRDTKDTKENPLLGVLKAKVLPDVETTEPVEGLLYFLIDGKIKPKDLAIVYKGQAGKLIMEFANPK